MARLLTIPLVVLLAACGDNAMRYIPPSDRALLEAEARLGRGAPADAEGRTTVADILARARGQAASGPAAGPGALVLRFEGDQVQPDAAQRERLRAYAAANRGARLVVTGGRGDPAMLGERRAVAVARLLEPDIPEVQLRFASGAGADVVQIASDAGTSLAPDGGR
jgi:hypothetical protein